MMVAIPSRSSGWSSTLRTRIRVACIVSFILIASLPALALNPTHDISQYSHTTWLVRDGAVKGYPFSFAQTPDGYLWLGTELGLVRFDGVRVLPWRPPPGTTLPSTFIAKLLVGHDGSLWIGTSQGLARWKDGKLISYRELSGQYIAALAADRDGTVWVGTAQVNVGESAQLCAIADEAPVECQGKEHVFGHFVMSLYEDSRRNLWVGAATGLWRWRPGTHQVYSVQEQYPEVHSVLEVGDNDVLVASNRDIKRVVGTSLVRYPLQNTDLIKPTVLFEDRDGGLWIGTQDRGLVHVHGGRTDRYSRSGGLSGDSVLDVFEDREGNIWVATINGFDRFRDVAVATVSTTQGLSSNTITAIVAARDTSVWIRTIKGLDAWRNGRVTNYGVRGQDSTDAGSSLFEDHLGRLWVSSRRGVAYFATGRAVNVRVGGGGLVHAFAEDDAHDLWISDQDHGLRHIRGQRLVDTVPWTTFGRGDARSLASDLRRGGLWLGFSQGGISYYKDSRTVASFTAADGLGRGEVTSLRLDQDGALWAATQGGLSRVKDGRIATLNARNGLPCDAVHWSIEDDVHSVWLQTACGLMRIPRAELDAWGTKPTRAVHATIYGEADGVSSHTSLSSYSPAVTKDRDGKLWFATYDGVGVIDPRRIPFNPLMPPVHIEQVVADRTAYDTSSRLRLPPLVRDLRIDYTAISLVAPEKVRFRYKLEGRDQDWVDAENRRQAFYTDLPPGQYRFRVSASNNDGVWNESGDAWQFAIAPAFYQTPVFMAGLGLAAVALLWTLQQMWSRRLASQMNARFNERLAERTRIAQELHDTLLQGSISASMQLHVLASEVADHSLRLKLDRILQRFHQMIEEGRQTVQALRSSPKLADDLERALVRDAEYLRGDQAVDVRLVVEGRVRPLHPLMRDECYRIGREALANAFCHAQATSVVIEVEYGTHLRVRIRDNGCGIDPAILGSGRAGHWGIRGMHERAEQIGAVVKVSSRRDVGTEVELSVPGSLAFRPAEPHGHRLASHGNERQTRVVRQGRRVVSAAKEMLIRIVPGWMGSGPPG